ncbi:MAG: phage major capsid protein [Anaerolineae bacterium]
MKIACDSSPIEGAGPALGDELSRIEGMLSRLEEAQGKAQNLARAQCSALLTSRLNASNLPEPLKEDIRSQFEERIFSAEELEQAVRAKEKVLAGLLEDKVITGLGQQRPAVRGMWTSLDRIQLAFNRLMGLEIPKQHSDIPKLSGIRELYILLTGDYDFHGRFYPERVQLANVTTSTMTSVVKNALNEVMLEYFNLQPKWWQPIAYEEDFPTMDDVTWITTGGFGDLPTVSEGNAYTELSWSDNEEVTSFIKKGGYIGITLEVIDRDKVAAVKAIPRKLGLAAWRTVSSMVSELFTANNGVGPQMDCGHNVFDSTNHGNLDSEALSATAWDNVVQAMFKQTEASSGKRLGIRPAYLLVPIELEKTALEILTSEGEPGTSNNTRNVRRLAADRVITVPEWTDANNWAAAAEPAMAQGVCIGYRFGRAPELFIADDEAVGSMFTNDEMRIKARFVVTVGVADYRALYKNNVA